MSKCGEYAKAITGEYKAPDFNDKIKIGRNIKFLVQTKSAKHEYFEVLAAQFREKLRAKGLPFEKVFVSKGPYCDNKVSVWIKS